MNITSAKYWRPITGSGDNTCIIVVSSLGVLNVPIDTNNTDYQTVMSWKDAGNIIEDAD